MNNLERLKLNGDTLDQMLLALKGTSRSMLLRRRELLRRIDGMLEESEGLAQQLSRAQHEAAAALAEGTGLSRSGHEIAREQIAKHGVDRYPTLDAQMLKLVEETGELAGEVLAHSARDGISPGFRREYADVGLAYFALGSKLALNAIAEMETLVEGDRRDFRAGSSGVVQMHPRGGAQ